MCACSVPEKGSGSESNKAAREVIRCNYSSYVSACLWGLAAIWLNTPHFEKFVILAVRSLALKFGTNPHSLILQNLGNVEMWLLV